MRLSESDEAMLAGRRGRGVAFAMRVVLRVAEAMGADSLLDISGAHIDSCLYHGQASLDFVDRLMPDQARVAVPTTLNVSSLDLLHPHRYRGDPTDEAASMRLTQSYEQLGCEPTWTCAPYQRARRPKFGDHVAWAESNAIVFANSVLGARTHRYGDFIDICAALTGRAPAAGFHLDENRLGSTVYRLDGLRDELLDSDMLYPVLGYLVGADCRTGVPVIDGLAPDQPEHRLKALGAAAASSGSIAMFHAVQNTPEAPTLRAALGGRHPDREVVVDPAALRECRALLAPEPGVVVGAVCLGTPHYGVIEFARLTGVLGGRSFADTVAVYVNTSREVWHEVQLRGWARTLEAAGVRVVTDTCTYITPVMEPFEGLAVTDSAKWAHYAPGNIEVEAALLGLEDCVASGVAGQVVSDTDDWWQGR